MQSSQLACPHCGSTLNFGAEIAAGAAVDCLVCMQSFNIQKSFTPAPARVGRPGPKHKMPPADMPTVSDSKTGPLPKVAPPADERKKSAASKKRATESAASKPLENPASLADHPRRKISFAAVGLGLLLLLMASTGLAMWKLAGHAGDQANKAAPKEELLAVNTNVAPESAGNVASPPSVDMVLPPAEPQKLPPLEALDQSPPLKFLPQNDPPIKTDEKSEAPKAKELDVIVPVKGVVNPGKAVVFAGLDPNRPLPWGVDQGKINAAIDRGVAFLKANQNANGSWSNAHPVGHAAIGGLTLLEGGVPADDPSVKRAAILVRNQVPTLDQTYELSLAILFLDRLGDPKDRFTIQTLALRLVAGQTASGGWSYHCPVLKSNEMNQLFTFLHATKKLNVFDHQLLVTRGPQSDDLTGLMGKDPGHASDPVKEFSDRLLMATENGTSPASPTTPRPPAKAPAAKGANAPAGKANTPAVQPNWLKQVLPTLPIVQQQAAKKGKFKLTGDRSDNSNTQFALLALWVSGRHYVPAAQSLLGAHQRFLATQHGDGGWNYQPAGPKGTTPSMTCVGLLGMAMGHGAQPEIVGVNPKNPKEVTIKPALQDPRVQSGLKALGRTIGTPSAKAKAFPMHNLYELWSIERVAMLYELKAIDGKDWYGWGAQILLHNQRADGAWVISNYHGQNPHLNTCLAVLFLKRSNLAQDLTRSLQRESAIRAPLFVDQDKSPGP